MELDAILRASRATDEFKRDVLAFRHQGRAARIGAPHHAPPVKVLRVISQLLAEHPDYTVLSIRVEARAGCSDYIGTLDVDTAEGPRRFEFTWCCRWRAELEGWLDYFGFPDQIRAAREYDWRCFQRWVQLEPPTLN
jgi:DNA-binding transcriptional LysR family regulator